MFAKEKAKRLRREGGWLCKHCGVVFETNWQLKNHIKENHYRVDEEGNRIRWNKGLTAENCEGIARAQKTLKENIKSGKTVIKGHKLSEETKKKISEARKKYLLEHPEKAPYKLCHRHIKGESYPERYFRKILSKYKVDFKQEVQCGLYSLDFLVGNVDLEIDGHQHYSDERIIESDKRRTNFLEENGFVVKRIRWSWYSKLSTEERKNFIYELIQFLNNTKECPFPLLNNKVKRTVKRREKRKTKRTTKIKQPKQQKKQRGRERKQKKCPICGELFFGKRKYCSDECLRKDIEKNIPSKEELLKKIEEIGFNKVQLGKFYGVSDNSVNKWLVKYGIPKSHKEFKIWLELR